MFGLITFPVVLAFLPNCHASTTSPNSPRIIDGTITTPGQVPYQLSIKYHGLHHCGASLTEVDGTQVAITAAHCTSQFSPDSLTLVGGDTQLSVKTGLEQERKVVKIVNHAKFRHNVSLMSHDIAIMFFDKPFELNGVVGVIPLPVQGQETGGSLLISGWGIYDSEGFISDHLTYLEIPHVDYDVCKQIYPVLTNESANQFMCAVIPNVKGTKDCKGDSGGPIKSIDQRTLVGIISWRAGCGHPNYPTVNTKVSRFVDWVVGNVRAYRGDESKDDEDESDERV